MCKYVLKCLAGLILLMSLLTACSGERAQLRRQYLGQPLVGNTPQIFAPGLISKPGTKEGNAAFSPDGKHFFFVEQNYFKTILIHQMNFDGSQWSRPARASFSDQRNNWQPFLAPSGDLLLFVSSRPPAINRWIPAVWKTEKTTDGQWAEPQMIELPMASNEGVWHPTISRSGTLFFSAYVNTAQSFGESDIYYSDTGSEWLEMQSLGPVINTRDVESHPYIAPDESYLIFSSNRPGGMGKLDLYISFAEEDQWGTPLHLGKRINSPADELSPRVTPDGNFIFFDRLEGEEQDIYWVSAAIIDRLRR